MAQHNPQDIERYWREQNPRRREMRAAINARRLPYGIAVCNLSKEWNIGNLLRTANAFLAGEIILIGRADFDDTGSARIHRFERMHHVPDQAAFRAYAEQQGYQTVAVEIDPRAELLPEFRYPAKPLFVLGSELAGLPVDLSEAAHHRVMIPQYGLIPCLNVNISCSIVLYDYVTRTHPDLRPAPVEGAKYKLYPGSGRDQPPA
jgi:tRNA G18 (ribose-2'-O)-methylase SpoU